MQIIIHEMICAVHTIRVINVLLSHATRDCYWTSCTTRLHIKAEAHQCPLPQHIAQNSPSNAIFVDKKCLMLYYFTDIFTKVMRNTILSGNAGSIQGWCWPELAQYQANNKCLVGYLKHRAVLIELNFQKTDTIFTKVDLVCSYYSFISWPALPE